MKDDFALRLQARLQRATLDEPKGNGLLAVLGGLAIAVGAMVAISYAADHAPQCWRLLWAVTRATRTVLEGG